MRVNVIEKEVMNPLAQISEANEKLTPIPHDFECVSLFDNTKPGAKTILTFLKDHLGKRSFIHVKKAAGAPATNKQLDNAAKGEISILALGDCGSCSSWVVMDAIRLEKLGTPTISICSEKFSNFAQELAKSHGLEDLRILNIEHPIAGLSDNEIRNKTQKILPYLRYILKIP
jgi:hypothetical protein